MKDPRMQTLKALMEEEGLNVQNPVKDISRAREWARKEVERCKSPLVSLVYSDEQAFAMIEAAYSWITMNNLKNMGFTNV